MPQLRDYPQVTTSTGTDGLWLDRIGVGTVWIDIANLGTSFVPNQPTTNQQFTQNGAVVDNLNDIVQVGGSTANARNFPNANNDWLSAFQVAAGLSNGSLISSQMSVLTNNAPGMGFGFLAGSQTLHFTSAGTGCIGTGSYAVNNNATLLTQAWAYYGEAHLTSAAVNSVYGMELDTRTLFASVTPTPNQQGNVIGIQIASGCGLAAGPQFDASAAIQIVANPMKWKVGINMMAGAIASGGNAMTLPSNAPIQFINVGGHFAGQILSTATGSNDYGLNFQDGGMLVTGNSGVSICNFSAAVNAADYLSVTANISGSGPTIAATGPGTDVGINLSGKGAGKVIAIMDVIWKPTASLTIGTNGEFGVEATSNTQITLVYRGSDGTTRRSAPITVS